MTLDKIKEILDMLNNLQENLLSLPDDMLLNIDSRDNESLEEGIQCIKSFNTNLEKFTESSAKLSEQIKTYFAINPEEEDVEKETCNGQERDRIIKDLDKTTPHTLDENFTYKCPYGFILQDTPYKGIKTWRSLYFNVLNVLYEKEPAKFMLLPEEENFISKHGNPLFSKDKSHLRVAGKLPAGFYMEINLSANHIRSNVEELFKHFKINPDEMKIYLREDRDAENRNS